MTGNVRRFKLLTALALLLSGLFQPLAAAQGVMCARTHAPALDAIQLNDLAGNRLLTEDQASGALTDPDVHDSIPQPDVAVVSSSPCGSAALPSHQRIPSSIVMGRQLLQVGDTPPASLLIQSLFRPPRLS